MALTDKKQEALRLLSSGHSIPKAAAEIGVGRATVWKWTKEPEFSAELTVYRNKEAAGAQMNITPPRLFVKPVKPPLVPSEIG